MGTSAAADSAQWTAAVWDVGDGSTRMLEGLPTEGRTSTMRAAAAAGGVVVAGGSVDCGVGPAPAVWIRRDGAWSSSIVLGDTGRSTITDVAAGPGGFAAVGEASGAARPIVWTSRDGGAWTSSEVPGADGMTLTKVASSPQGWVLFGAAPTPGGWRPAAWIADELGQWHGVEAPAVRVLDAGWIDDQWVAVGTAPAGGPAISRSADGRLWEAVVPTDGSPLSSITNVVEASGHALALVTGGGEPLVALDGTTLGPPVGIPGLPGVARPPGPAAPLYTEHGLMAGDGNRVMLGSPRRDGITFAELGPGGWTIHDGTALGAWGEHRRIEVQEIEGAAAGEVIVLATRDVDPVSGQAGNAIPSVWSRPGPDVQFQEQFEGSDQVAATTGALYAVQSGELGLVWSPDGRLWQLSTLYGIPNGSRIEHLWADDGGIWVFSAGAGSRVFRADAPALGGEVLRFAPVTADVAGVDEVRGQCRADGRTTMVGHGSDPAGAALAVSGDTGGLTASVLAAPAGTANPRANECAVLGATVVVAGTVDEPIPAQGFLLARADHRQRAVTWRSTDGGATWASTLLPTADDHPATSTNGFAVTTERERGVRRRRGLHGRGCLGRSGAVALVRRRPHLADRRQRRRRGGPRRLHGGDRHRWGRQPRGRRRGLGRDLAPRDAGLSWIRRR